MDKKDTYCPYNHQEYKRGINQDLAEFCPYCEKMLLGTCSWWNRKLQEKPIYEIWRMGKGQSRHSVRRC